LLKRLILGLIKEGDEKTQKNQQRFVAVLVFLFFELSWYILPSPEERAYLIWRGIIVARLGGYVKDNLIAVGHAPAMCSIAPGDCQEQLFHGFFLLFIQCPTGAELIYKHFL